VSSHADHVVPLENREYMTRQGKKSSVKIKESTSRRMMENRPPLMHIPKTKITQKVDRVREETFGKKGSKINVIDFT